MAFCIYARHDDYAPTTSWSLLAGEEARKKQRDQSSKALVSFSQRFDVQKASYFSGG